MSYVTGTWGEQAKERQRKRVLLGETKKNAINYKKKLKEKIFEKYGSRCNKCGFVDIRALQLDHVNGGGSKDRQAKGGHWRVLRDALLDTTGKYQILCANCNWIKRYEEKE